MADRRLLLLALFAANAFAQPLEEPDEPTARWRVSVGGGLLHAPKYPGADSYRLRALPVVSASYGNFFVGGEPGSGGAAVGVNLIRDSGWRLGVGLSPGFGRARRESDHPSLQGMGDIDRTTRAVLFGGTTWRRWLSATLRVAPDVEGNDQGTLVSFDVTARWRAAERLTLSAGPGVTWADRDYTMTFFGVTPEQSARSGLPAYEAGSGWHAARFGVGASYRFAPRWTLATRLTAWRIVGDAADSPITRERDPYGAAAFVTYRF